MAQVVASIAREIEEPFILHILYYGCWWSGDTRNKIIWLTLVSTCFSGIFIFSSTSWVNEIQLYIYRQRGRWQSPKTIYMYIRFLVRYLLNYSNCNAHAWKTKSTYWIHIACNTFPSIPYLSEYVYNRVALLSDHTICVYITTDLK